MNNVKIEEYFTALKEEDDYIRWEAIAKLVDFGLEAVPRLMEALAQGLRVRHSAMEALVKIGTPAVPSLIRAIRHENRTVRQSACQTLGSIGDVSAVSALVQAGTDKADVRRSALEALVRIGVPAVPSLIRALKDRRPPVRELAHTALDKLGNAETLPRKILAASHFSAHERVEMLDALRHTIYKPPPKKREPYFFADYEKTYVEPVRYVFPETRALCLMVLHEQDADARRGAQTVLNWLNGEQDLLIASQPDTMPPAQHLLRAAPQEHPDTHSDSLLRASCDTAKKGSDLSRTTAPVAKTVGKEAATGQITTSERIQSVGDKAGCQGSRVKLFTGFAVCRTVIDGRKARLFARFCLNGC